MALFKSSMLSSINCTVVDAYLFLPFVVIIGGLTQDVIDNISLETGTGNYQNIIIAHKQVRIPYSMRWS